MTDITNTIARFFSMFDFIRYHLTTLNLEFYQINKQSQNYGVANKMYGVVVLLCLSLLYMLVVLVVYLPVPTTV